MSARSGRVRLPLLAVGLVFIGVLILRSRKPPELPEEQDAPRPPASEGAPTTEAPWNPHAGIPKARPREKWVPPPEQVREQHRLRLDEVRRREAKRVKEEYEAKRGPKAPPEEYTPEEAAERFPSPYGDGNPFKMEYR